MALEGTVPPRQLLILSDGKPGHLNQSLAFAKLLGYSWQVRRVAFKSRFCKALAYVGDRLGLCLPGLFRLEGGGLRAAQWSPPDRKPITPTRCWPAA